MTHIIIDMANLFFRTKYIAKGDADLKGGMAIHICFTSINKVWQKFDGSHIIIALEGGKVWRRNFLPTYKAHRQVERNMRTSHEIEEDEIFFEYMNEFTKFLINKTNVTVLQTSECEADDVIARWIQLHPDDDHVILSNDTDFYQLLSSNVTIYRGQTNETVTLEGVFEDNGKPVLDKKTNQDKKGPDPEWELFKKIMRGDPGDGVHRACQKGLRETKLREAFDDRATKGFFWNNIMLSEWADHNGVNKRVIDRYELNTILIDLSKQPAEIISKLDQGIIDAAEKANIPSSKIGFAFLKFCEAFSLKRLSDQAETYTKFLKATYN